MRRHNPSLSQVPPISLPSRRARSRRISRCIESLEPRLLLLGTPYFDNFEASTLNPFWTPVEQAGAISFPATAQAHSGSRSVQFTSNQTADKFIALQHTFQRAEYGKFSVWFYDNTVGSTAGNYAALWLYNTGTGQRAGITTLDNQGTRFGAHLDNEQTRLVGARSTGWHQFLIDTTSTEIRYEIDSQVVRTEPIDHAFDQISLQLAAPSYRPSVTAYFDDFSYTPYSSDLSLTAQSFYGTPNDERATGIALDGADVYISGYTSASGDDALLARFSPKDSTHALLQPWTSVWPNSPGYDRFAGVATAGGNIFAAGTSYSRTTDNVGDKEFKGITVRYTTDGNVVWDRQTPAAPGVFDYGGIEQVLANAAALEDGQAYAYATGYAQYHGANGGRVFLSKLDAAGNILWTRTDPGATPNSAGHDVAAAGGAVVVAGYTADSGAVQPYLKRYDVNGNLQWARTGGSGVYEGVTVDPDANRIYAVGYTLGSRDFFLEAWDLSGTRLWSRAHDRAGGDDFLYGVATAPGRLYAAGSTTANTAGGSDGVILSLDPATGDLQDTTLWGGPADDAFTDLIFSNNTLHLSAETQSFGAGGYDLAYLAYALESPVADLAATALQWNSARDQIEWAYESTLVPPASSATLALYYASGPTIDTRLGNPIYTAPVDPADGLHGPFSIPASTLPTAPANAAYLLLVLDPPTPANPFQGALAEANESNNLLAVRVDAPTRIAFTADLSTSELVDVNGTLFFTTDTDPTGLELWKTDGTEAGTVRVKDINPAGSSNPKYLANVNGTLFFAADDGVNGVELWKSDGTEAGTVKVKDINPGATGSSPDELVNVNGILFFAAYDATNGRELWKSDGTAAGTVLIRDFFPGTVGSQPDALISINGTLFFTTDDGTSGRELWKSDGTAAGTVLVKDIVPGAEGSYPTELTNVNGTLFFTTADWTNAATRLWKSDGSEAGTLLVKDFAAANISYPGELTSVNGTLFFTASDPTNGQELWKSDGTDAGTGLVKDIYPGSYGSTPAYLTSFKGQLFFSASDGTNYTELWRSDGTSAGTVLVKDINSGWNSSSPANLVDVNGALFFTARENASGVELWKTDGTDSGTLRVKDIFPGAASSTPTGLTGVNGTLYFRANNGTNGFELWKSDGATAGTMIVKDVRPISSNASPEKPTSAGSTLFFRMNDGASGIELWKSDGTAAGTAIVKDLNPGPGDSSPDNLVNINGTLFFTASDGATGVELWRTDGTAAGTVRIKDINPGAGSSSPRYLTNVNGTLFFSAYEPTGGTELWKSDGTSAGTVRVHDIAPGSVGSSLDQLVNLNGTLFFRVYSSATGSELWKSDGTVAGTVLVKDINPGASSSSPSQLTSVNGTLFFIANDGTSGVELWKTDGTTAGTVLVKEINPGANGSNPDQLVNLNGTLFFIANDGTSGRELWKSNGTAAGTVLVKDIYPGSSGPYPQRLTNVNGTLFFSAYSSPAGYELWKSDGTSAGTVLVKDIYPGGNSDPLNLTSVNGTLLFTASDYATGRELWMSDGTAAGTRRVKDIFADRRSALPSGLTDVNGTLFFSVGDDTVGYELWKYAPSGDPSPVADLAATTLQWNSARDRIEWAYDSSRVPSGSSATLALYYASGLAFDTRLGNPVYTAPIDPADGSHGPFSIPASALPTVPANALYLLLVLDPISPGHPLHGELTELNEANNILSVPATLPSRVSFVSDLYGSELANVNGTLFFTTDTDLYGLELWKTDGTEAGTVRVKDINPAGSSSPKNLTSFNGVLFFTADDGSHGRELWRSDGTEAGTVLVKDINPGAAGSSPDSLVSMSNTLFFAATDGGSGIELWKSDGTTAGTTFVKDIYPGINGSSPTKLISSGGTLYFVAYDLLNRRSIWKSDGTSAGTVVLNDLYVDLGQYSNAYDLAAVNGTLFVALEDETGAYGLWRSDGTTAGSFLLNQVPRGTQSWYPHYLTNANGTLFFTAYDPTYGTELWKSDGTAAGTVLVKDIYPGANGSDPYNLVNINGTLFFTAHDPTYGTELWKSDGTAAGTTIVKDIYAGAGAAFPTNLANVNGTLFFIANDGTSGNELWKSDGTATGTMMVRDIFFGAQSSSPADLTNVDGTLFFRATNGTNGFELWKSDGTAAGTMMLRDVRPASGNSAPQQLTSVNGTLFFRMANGIDGVELWKSDGTEAGTAMVKDIYPGPASSNPANLVSLDGLLLFTADDGVHGAELWRSDGTANGTYMVRDIYPGSAGSGPAELTSINGMLFFRANNGTSGVEFWRSNGTSAGTFMIKDLAPGAASSNPAELTNVNGTIFFQASNGANGIELWKSNGVSGGTVMVKDINAGSNSSSPDRLVNVNGALFFVADNGTSGRELWKSDGTAIGTVMVKDINPGASAFNSYVGRPIDLNGTLIFTANDGNSSYELWRSDGTETGTVLIKDIYPGANGSGPDNLTNVDGTIFFTAYDPTSGRNLWKSDGTPAGTVMVKHIYGPGYGYPPELTGINGNLFFRAADYANGYELWRSNGTDAGTVMVDDIFPGTLNSSPTELTDVNGTLFFAVGSDAVGYELWKYVPPGSPRITADLAATSFNWISATDRIEWAYESTLVPAGSSATLALYYASGPTFSARIGNPIHTAPVDLAGGFRGPFSIPASTLPAAPSNATHLLLVLDPSDPTHPAGLIDETNESNNLLSLPLYSISWTGLGDNASWSDPANWSTASLPGPNDRVLINAPGATVTFPSGEASMRALSTTANLRLSGSTFTVNGPLQLSSASLTINNTTLQNATLSASGPASVTTTDGATLDRVTLATPLQAGNGRLRIADGLRFLTGGSLSVSGGGLYFWYGEQSISGDGQIRLDQAAIYLGYEPSSWMTGTLTLEPGVTLSGAGNVHGYSDSTLINKGTIKADVDRQDGSYPPLFIDAAHLQNEGSILATNRALLRITSTMTQTGTLSVDAGATITISGDLTQTAGSTLLSNGILDPEGRFIVNGGEVSGDGSILADVLNSAHVAPGGAAAPGNLRIEGAYVQSATGSLDLDIGGPNPADYDQLQITAAATLNGTLNLSPVNDYLSPPQGTLFTVLPAASVAGRFNAITGARLPTDYGYDPVYSPATFALSAYARGPIRVSLFIDEDDGDRSPADLSLREAIALAAQYPGDDEILLPAGFYGLDGAELTIRDPDGRLTLRAEGGPVTINAREASRVLRIDNSTVDLIGLTIQNGHATDAYAGGIYATGSTLSLTDSAVESNLATLHGGGVYVSSSNLVLARTSVSFNLSLDAGAGIYATGSTLTIVDSVISQNAALRSRGGGIHLEASSLHLLSSTLAGNTATGPVGFGGAISAINSSLYLANATLSGNSAGIAGAFMNGAESSATLVNCTIYQNSGDFTGGIFNDAASNLTLANSIVALNSSDAAETVDLLNVATFTSLGHNLIGVGNPAVPLHATDLYGSPAAPLDPRLGPLQDNGGASPTHLPLYSSDVVNAGDNDLAFDLGASLLTDQRGAPRITGPAVDIGAVELRPAGLSAFNPLPNAVEDRPRSFTGANLASAAILDNPDQLSLLFRVDSILAGSLTVNGLPALPGLSFISPATQLAWTPPRPTIPSSEPTIVPAFTLSLFDAASESFGPAVPVSFEVTWTADNYALLFSGGVNEALDFDTYYRNVLRLYTILTDPAQYALKPANITVLNAGGVTPPEFADDPIASEMAQRTRSATAANFRSALLEISQKIDANDHFFLWTYDHGLGLPDQPDRTDEEALAGWGSGEFIRDDELRVWTQGLRPGDDPAAYGVPAGYRGVEAGYSTFVFGQCYAGGMLDELDTGPRPTGRLAFGAAAASHYEYSYGDSFVAAFADALRAGYNSTQDAFRYTVAHNSRARDAANDGGAVAAGIEHPWSSGAAFPIFATSRSIQAVPELRTLWPLRAAPNELAFEITFDRVKAAASVFDPGNRAPVFEIVSVESGALLRDGLPINLADPAQRRLGFGQSVTWLRPPGDDGLYPALRLRLALEGSRGDELVLFVRVGSPTGQAAAFDDVGLMQTNGIDLLLDVLGNDIGRNIEVKNIGAPLHGEVTLDETTGQLRYTPAPGFTGSDTFTYVMGNAAATDIARVSIGVSSFDIATAMQLGVGFRATPLDPPAGWAGIPADWYIDQPDQPDSREELPRWLDTFASDINDDGLVLVRTQGRETSPVFSADDIAYFGGTTGAYLWQSGQVRPYWQPRGVGGTTTWSETGSANMLTKAVSDPWFGRRAIHSLVPTTIQDLGLVPVLHYLDPKNGEEEHKFRSAVMFDMGQGSEFLLDISNGLEVVGTDLAASSAQGANAPQTDRTVVFNNTETGTVQLYTLHRDNTNISMIPLTELVAEGGDGYTIATATGPAGRIIGRAHANGASEPVWHAFFFDPASGAGLQDLGTLEPANPAMQSIATALNAQDQVVGYATAAPLNTPAAERSATAFRWDRATAIMQPLHPLPRSGGVASWSVAYDINDAGVVVGASNDRAVMWLGDEITNLNDVVDNLPPNWTLTEARGINNRGQIVATATTETGRTRAMFLDLYHLLAAIDDSVPVLSRTALEFNVLDNDYGRLTVQSVDTTGLTGALRSWDARGHMVFDPAGAFDDLPFGQQTVTQFAYTARDDWGATMTATAYLTITGAGPHAVQIDAQPGDNAYTLRLSPNAASVELSHNALPTASWPVADLSGLVLPQGSSLAQLTIDLRNGNPIPPSGLDFSAGSASGAITILGAAQSEQITLRSGSVTINGRTITSPSLSGVRFSGGDGDDTLRIEDRLEFTPVFDAGAGKDTLSIRSGSYDFSAQSLIATPDLRIIADGSTRIMLSSSRQLSSLSIGDNSTVALVGNGGDVLDLADLQISRLGTLDLGPNTLIFRAAGEAAARDAERQLIELTRRANRTGLLSDIASRHAPGAIGIHLVRTNNLVQLAFGWNGDADNNGIVDADDYFRIDSGRMRHNAGYASGDFNYSGSIDADDYQLIDAAFRAQPRPTSPASPSTLPAANPWASPLDLASDPSDDDPLFARLELPADTFL